MIIRKQGEDIIENRRKTGNSGNGCIGIKTSKNGTPVRLMALPGGGGSGLWPFPCHTSSMRSLGYGSKALTKGVRRYAFPSPRHLHPCVTWQARTRANRGSDTSEFSMFSRTMSKNSRKSANCSQYLDKCQKSSRMPVNHDGKESNGRSAKMSSTMTDFRTRQPGIDGLKQQMLHEANDNDRNAHRHAFFLPGQGLASGASGETALEV